MKFNFFRSSVGYKKLDNFEPSIDDPYGFCNTIFPNLIFKYFPKHEKGPLKEEFDNIMKVLTPIYKNFIKRNQDALFIVKNHFGAPFNFLSLTELERIEIVKKMKGGYEMVPFLSKYNFSDEIRKKIALEIAHIDYFALRYDIINFKNTPKDSFSTDYFYHMLAIRFSKMDSLLKKVSNFSFHDLILLSKEIDDSKNEEFWIEFNKFWADYDLDVYFTPLEYAIAYKHVKNKDQYHDEVCLYYSIYLLRLGFSTLVSGSYRGIDGVYYFLCAADFLMKENIYPKWIFTGLGFYNRIEVHNFCKINNIDKKYIGVSIQNKFEKVKQKID